MQLQQPPQRWDTMPLSHQIALINRLLHICALTVMVFLRRDVGYRLLNPLHLIGVLIVMGFICGLGDSADPQARFGDLLFFAVFAFLLAMGQRAKRLKEMKRGIVQHSYYIGTSRFEWGWLPRFCRRNRRMARFVDPLFCILVGIVLLPVSTALGCWLIFGGFCVISLEGTVQQREQHMDMDMMDSFIAAQIQSQVVQDFEDAGATRRQRTTTGIPTGLGPDIQKQFNRRKAN